MRTGMHTLLALLAFSGALLAACGKPVPVDPEP